MRRLAPVSYTHLDVYKRQALKADSIAAQRGIMMLDLDAGRTAEALAMARQVQKQRPKEAVGYVLEGDVHALKKGWSEACLLYTSRCV